MTKKSIATPIGQPTKHVDLNSKERLVYNTIQQEAEEAKKELYKAQRHVKYPQLGDQLDEIIKQVEAICLALELPLEPGFKDLLKTINRIKKEYPRDDKHSD